MDVNNKYFYFGKMSPEVMEMMDVPDGWEDGWCFRIRIDTEEEEIKIEDCCNRMVPMAFNDLYQFIGILQKVQNELITSLVGAPNNA